MSGTTLHAARRSAPDHIRLPLIRVRAGCVGRASPPEGRPIPPRPRIAILGAGPIGLEAALAAAGRGWPVTVYEAAATVAGHVRAWGHIRLFTPWSMNVSARMRAALPDAPDGDGLPTGTELVEALYEPVAAVPALAGSVRLGTRVLAVSRDRTLKHDEIGTGRRADRPFRLLVQTPGGEERIERADAVLDCTGTYGHPNVLGDGGIPAPGERGLAHRIGYHLPRLDLEPEAWAGRTILLSGAGHSAQTAARALAELARAAPDTRVVWAVRSPEPHWYGVEDDPLPERAALTRAARELSAGASDAVEVRHGRVTEALADRAGRVAVTLRNGSSEELEVDRVLALNGGVGDFTLYRQLQIHECYATAGPMKLAAALLGGGGGDCLTQASHGADALTNPEPGFFILGAKSYGRNSQFLLRTGWDQVADVFGLLDATP
jgi:cation diffusion facilitator CzcD-associated flavoprotein CzcO